MQARRITSKKWTQFPAEFNQQIQSVFMENFGPQLKDSKLIIEGRIYPEEILLRVGMLEKGRLAQQNFEVSVDYKNSESETVLERIHALVDVAGSMMLEYFEKDGEVEFPYTWKEFPFKGQPVFLQYSTENTDLEAQANAILGLNEDSLLLGDDKVSDALDLAEKDHLH